MRDVFELTDAVMDENLLAVADFSSTTVLVISVMLAMLPRTDASTTSVLCAITRSRSAITDMIDIAPADAVESPALPLVLPADGDSTQA